MEGKEFYTFLVTIIISSFVGWFFNQLSHWRTIKGEDIKKTKRVLFNLLEIYYLIKIIDFPIVNKISDKVMTRMPKESQNIQTREFIRKIYSGFVQQYITPELMNQLKEAEQNYLSSINILTEIDPINAFWLNKKASLFPRYLEEMNRWIDNLQKEYSINSKDIEIGKKSINDVVKPELTSELLVALENDISYISKKINLIVFLKAKRQVKRIKTIVSKELDKKMDELLDKIVKNYLNLENTQ